MDVARADPVNILLVDDQPAKLVAYEAILGHLGERLIPVCSATEALERLLQQDIAVVLMDVVMPDLDGYELAVMIRRHPRFQRVSIIFVSALLMTDLDRLRGYECGGVDYVPVPVVPEILRAKVSVFAELHRKTRALEQLNAQLEARVAERTAALEASTMALREADKRKDEFLAILAHELRNPLAPIRTALQVLRRPGLEPAQEVRVRDIVDRQVQHLASLIDDLLDVSRIGQGRVKLQRERVPLDAVIDRAVETARSLIEARQHALTIDLPAETPHVFGDRTRLAQIVGNILHNAAKFTEPGGRIAVTVRREGGEATVRVSDTGIGIPPAHLSRVFELFSQVHDTSEGVQGGLGIGLALVRRFVEMHGGTVTATSAGVGHGTEVTVTLPTIETVAALAGRAAEPTTVPAAPKARKILVADDNRDAVETLTLQLRLAGHEVRSAKDGVEALAVAETFAPQVVLLDLGMPKMDGYETARQIRNRDWGQTAMVVALSGWGSAIERQKSSDAGFDAHLVKPVAEHDLFAAIAGERLPRGRPIAGGST